MDIQGARISGLNIGDEAPLYTFTTWTFTNGNSVGRTGPTTANLRALYNTTGNTWINDNSFFTSNAGVQLWTVPRSGTYRVLARGAQGGPFAANAGGVGAVIQGDFLITKGTVLRVLVGQTATIASGRLYRDSPGGGGSFVVRNPSSGNPSVNDILVIAGGGGGTGFSFLPAANASVGTSGNAAVGGSFAGTGGTNGSGGGQSIGATSNGAGGGFLTDGAANGSGGGKSFLSGGLGGDTNALYAPTGGGFGGGGAPNNGDLNRYAGGGGYSGGGASDAGGSVASNNIAGGGGGSFNAGNNQVNLGNVFGNFGNGSVTITFLSSL